MRRAILASETQKKREEWYAEWRSKNQKIDIEEEADLLELAYELSGRQYDEDARKRGEEVDGDGGSRPSSPEGLASGGGVSSPSGDDDDEDDVPSRGAGGRKGRAADD